jgi:hypothetical protein
MADNPLMAVVGKQKREEKAREAAATMEYPTGTSSVTQNQVPGGRTLTVPGGITLWSHGPMEVLGELVVEAGGGYVVL